MGERRPEPPAAKPSGPAIARSDLSPTQQAYAEYVDHAVACDTCRSVDAGPCALADVLWKTYRRLRREQAAARY